MDIIRQSIDINDYSYDLPEDKIAKFPLPERDRSKLLISKNYKISEDIFLNLDEYLPENSLMVFNNTKVIHARILFQRESGAQIEVFCLEPANNLDYQLAFQSKGSCEWKCMVGNAKRWKDEILIKKADSGVFGEIELRAEKLTQTEDAFHIKFSWQPAELHFSEIIHNAGLLPLPPYLNRESIASDEDRYQTVYAVTDGSVAAPTAGLHFTKSVFEKLNKKNIHKTFVTLHVGAGTFKPVKTSLEHHVMHEETIFISKQNLLEIQDCLIQNRPLIAVGTTSARTLESLYWHGVELINRSNKKEMSVSQWQPYETKGSFDKLRMTTVTTRDSIRSIINNLDENNSDELRGTTQILIVPGYEFKMVDVLITNFHQPGSTLMLLVAAFVGDQWKKIYEYALSNNFRFLSYGDSSVLFRK